MELLWTIRFSENRVGHYISIRSAQTNLSTVMTWEVTANPTKLSKIPKSGFYCQSGYMTSFVLKKPALLSQGHKCSLLTTTSSVTLIQRFPSQWRYLRTTRTWNDKDIFSNYIQTSEYLYQVFLNYNALFLHITGFNNLYIKFHHGI